MTTKEISQILKIYAKGPLEPLAKVIRIFPSRQVDTAAITERGLLVVNPSFYEGLTAEERIGLVLHEVLHLARHHFRRVADAGASPLEGNVASDLEVNGVLMHLGHKLPDGALIPDEVLPLEVWLERMRNGQGPTPQAPDGNEGGNGEGEDGRPMEGDMPSPDLQRKLEEEYEKKTGSPLPPKEAVDKAAGKVPGEISRLIEALESSKGLAQKLRRFLEDEFGLQVTLTWSKTPLEIFPHKRGTPRIGILLDASGSMELLLPEAVKVAKEVYSEFAEHFPLLASWDTRLVREYKRFPQHIACSLGGTAMDEGVRWMAGRGVSSVIVITDGYTPWREEILPRCRTLVVVLVERGDIHKFPAEGKTPTIYWEVNTKGGRK